eukprot:6009561-Pyramimonas_sp.AAC.1
MFGGPGPPVRVPGRSHEGEVYEREACPPPKLRGPRQGCTWTPSGLWGGAQLPRSTACLLLLLLILLVLLLLPSSRPRPRLLAGSWAAAPRLQVPRRSIPPCWRRCPGEAPASQPGRASDPGGNAPLGRARARDKSPSRSAPERSRG